MRPSVASRIARRVNDTTNNVVAKIVEMKTGSGVTGRVTPNTWKRAGDAAASLASDAVQKVLPGGGVLPKQVLDAASEAHQHIVDEIVAKSHGPRST